MKRTICAILMTAMLLTAAGCGETDVAQTTATTGVTEATQAAQPLPTEPTQITEPTETTQITEPTQITDPVEEPAEPEEPAPPRYDPCRLYTVQKILGLKSSYTVNDSDPYPYEVRYTYDGNALTGICHYDQGVLVREEVYGGTMDLLLSQIYYLSDGTPEYQEDYTYDRAGRCVGWARSFDGVRVSTQTWTYDERGDLIQWVTRNGDKETDGQSLTYDADGCLLEKVCTYGGNTMERYVYRYDGSHTLTGMTHEDGDLTYHYTYIYDDEGRRVQEQRVYEDGEPVQTFYRYDLWGRLTEVLECSGGGLEQQLLLEYDDEGRLTGTTDIATDDHIDYDGDCLSYIGHIGPGGNSDQEVLYELVTVNGTEAEVLAVIRDQLLLECIPGYVEDVGPEALSMIFTKPMEQLPDTVPVKTPAGFDPDKTYTVQKITRTDMALTEDGGDPFPGHTEYLYDGNALVGIRTYQGDRLTYEAVYDGSLDRMTSMKRYDEDGTVLEQESYRYTLSDGRIAQKECTTDGSVSTYHYDAAGVLEKIVTVDGEGAVAERSFTYDSEGRLVWEDLVWDDGRQSYKQYDYDAQGRLLREYDDGYVTYFTYDARGDLVNWDDIGCGSDLNYDDQGRLISCHSWSPSSGSDETVVYEMVTVSGDVARELAAIVDHVIYPW